MKRLMICLMILLTAVCSGQTNGPTPKVIVGTNGIADGSITAAKIADGAIGATAVEAGYELLTTAEKTQATIVNHNTTTQSLVGPTSRAEAYVNFTYVASTPILLKTLVLGRAATSHTGATMGTIRCAGNVWVEGTLFKEYDYIVQYNSAIPTVTLSTAIWDQGTPTISMVASGSYEVSIFLTASDANWAAGALWVDAVSLHNAGAQYNNAPLMPSFY